MKNGFRSLSFEKISVLDSNFIHRYIIINVGQVGFRVKFINYFWSYGPFSTLKSGFRSITFEKISELDSYFIHKHIIIKYRSNLSYGNIHQLFLELRPFINVVK